MPPKTTQAGKIEKTDRVDIAAAVVEPAPESLTDTVADIVLTHRVTGHGQNGFWRAGRHWPVEGVGVNRADFSDDHWAALESEPKISIKQL